jgi:hypothetical protein
MEYVNNNPNEALQVAFGLKAPPVGQTETAISISLADKALEIGNIELWNQLEASRSLRQTRRGQEIVSERGRFDNDSPHSILAKVMDKKLDILGDKVKGGVMKEFELENGRKPTNKEAAIKHIDKEAIKIQKEVTKQRATAKSKLDRMVEVIESLRCK